MRLRKNPLPLGTLPIGAGLVVNGLTAFGFLAVASRQLSADDYSVVSVLWFSVFMLGPGFFQPLEQEVGRIIASRDEAGEGAGPVVRQAATLGGGLALFLVAISFAVSAVLIDRLFHGEFIMMVGLLLALVGYCAAHLVRGLLAGHHRFGGYALFFGAEGVVRLAIVLLFALVGYETVGAYGLAIGFAPFLAASIAMYRQGHLAGPGPEANLGDLGRALGSLLAASAFTAFLLNVGPLAVQLLTGDDESSLAGQFANGLLVARIPLFFFQAVQAALLPQLSKLIGTKQYLEFEHAVEKLLLALAAVMAAVTVGFALLGPFAVDLMFGTEIKRLDVVLLSISTALFMATLVVAQGLIAVGTHGRLALGWFAGVVLFPIALTFANDPFLRVEIALLVAVTVSFFVMGTMLHRVLVERHAAVQQH